MRVLITGAGGFAGSHVVDVISRHHDVVGVDRPHCLYAIPQPVSALPLSALLREDPLCPPPVDVVISLAATADPGDALRDPAAAYENGVRVMVDTLEYARRVGARVLHVSTNEVYGSREGPVYAPRGPYAGAKACQEIVCQAYDDVPTTIVVTQSLFGERQQPNKLVPTAIRTLLAGDVVPLQRNGTRWASRPFLHARNLAEALLLLIERGGETRRVHVGAAEVLSVRDVVDVLADALGCESVAQAVPAGDRAGHELDVASIGCDLGPPPYDAVTALGNVARWYQENPEWLKLR